MGTEQQFPFLRVTDNFPRPILWVSLYNGHDAAKAPTIVPALIDTGADTTVIPISLCPDIGHEFAKGKPAPPFTGIAGQCSSFLHASRLVILRTSRANGYIAPKSLASPPFEPIVADFHFVDADIPFLILGQSDFLNYFQYTQIRHTNKFKLKQRFPFP